MCPAKIRDEPQFKPYVGRVFILRRHKKIPSFKNNKERVELQLEDFGEAVLITDENNTRVKVTLASGSLIWIPKFYLHKEIKSNSFREIDDISECIQELLILSKNIKRFDKNSEILLGYADGVEKVAKILRQYTDKINPTNKKK